MAAPIAEGSGFGGARSPSHPSESRNGRESQPARGEREAPTDLSSAGGASLSQRAGWGARSAATEPRGESGVGSVAGQVRDPRRATGSWWEVKSSRRLCSYPPSWTDAKPRGDPAPSPYRAPPAGVRDTTRATLTRSPRWFSHVSNALRVSTDRAVAGSVGRRSTRAALKSCPCFLSSLVG